MTFASIEISHHFDRQMWQSVPPLPEPASTCLLVTWTVEPKAVDSGMPSVVQASVAAALCMLGSVVYAADVDVQAVAPPIAQVPVRLGLRRLRLQLFSAHSAPQVLPAFESGLHPWSMNAQWLIVTTPSFIHGGFESLARTLYQEWHLPASWPDGLLLLVQAGTDGDAAICHFHDRLVDEQFCSALRRSCIETGVKFSLLDQGPDPG